MQLKIGLVRGKGVPAAHPHLPEFYPPPPSLFLILCAFHAFSRTDTSDRSVLSNGIRHYEGMVLHILKI